MSKDEREAEDVAGLFRKFGGDAKGYKEFEPAPEVAPARGGAWSLVPGAPAGPVPAPAPLSAPAVIAAPVVPMPAAVVRAAPAPAAAPSTAPAVPTAAAAPAPGGPRELDLLFARLAGQPQPAGAGGHGLMSRWRKPS